MNHHSTNTYLTITVPETSSEQNGDELPWSQSDTLVGAVFPWLARQTSAPFAVVRPTVSQHQHKAMLLLACLHSPPCKGAAEGVLSVL